MTQQSWRDAWRITRGIMSGRWPAGWFTDFSPEAMPHALTAWEARRRTDPLTLTTDTAWGLLKLQGIRSAGATTP